MGGRDIIFFHKGDGFGFAVLPMSDGLELAVLLWCARVSAPCDAHEVVELLSGSILVTGSILVIELLEALIGVLD